MRPSSLLSIFLHPKKTFLSKVLAHYCFLVFRRFGEYISQDLFSLAQPVNSSFKTSTPPLGKSSSSPLPSTFDSEDLPNVFSDYFTEKIRTIRNNFPPPNPIACHDTSFAGNILLTFGLVTNEFVLKIISSASDKSCELDPIPTTLLYENHDILLPTITNIINTSLTTGIVPRLPSSNLC